MPSTDDFREALAAILSDGARRHLDHIDVNVGDLHRRVGDYPGPNHAMPSCCAVMEQTRKAGDRVLAGPPSGKGASLTVRYQVPR